MPKVTLRRLPGRPVVTFIGTSAITMSFPAEINEFVIDAEEYCIRPLLRSKYFEIVEPEFRHLEGN